MQKYIVKNMKIPNVEFTFYHIYTDNKIKYKAC